MSKKTKVDIALDLDNTTLCFTIKGVNFSTCTDTELLQELDVVFSKLKKSFSAIRRKLSTELFCDDIVVDLPRISKNCSIQARLYKERKY